MLARAIAAPHRIGIEDHRLRAFSGIMQALLFMSLLEGMLHYPRFVMLIMIGFGVLLAAKEQRDEAGLSLQSVAAEEIGH